MNKEWERLWTARWLFAGVLTDLKEPGDFFIYDIEDSQ